MLNKANIEILFSQNKKLPTLPGIAAKIIATIPKKNAGLNEIAEIISMDPDLSIEVLKLINSSFYHLPDKIVSVPHALSMLGFNAIKHIALSFSLIKALKSDKKENGFDYTRFWKDALICAVSAKLIAHSIDKQLSDEAFFLGFVKNIGILALVQVMPKQYQMVLREADRNVADLSITAIENKTLGFNHLQVGGYLIRSWGFPESVALPVCHYSAPENIQCESSDTVMLAKILQMAHLYAKFFNARDKTIAYAKIESTKRDFGFENTFDTAEISREIETHAQKVFPIFCIEEQNRLGYHEMIEVARQQLDNTSMALISQLLRQKRQIEQLEEKIIYDSMTMLYNYCWFYKILSKESSRSQRHNLPLSVILTDIDNLKQVNDTHGYLAGDTVIKQIANTLKMYTRNTDLVARYGGEKFGIVLPGTHIIGALAIAERLRHKIASTSISYERKKLSVTMSFGVTALPSRTDITIHDLLKKTDQVLCEAKSKGKNRCCAYFV